MNTGLAVLISGLAVAADTLGLKQNRMMSQRVLCQGITVLPVMRTALSQTKIDDYNSGQRIQRR